MNCLAKMICESMAMPPLARQRSVCKLFMRLLLAELIAIMEISVDLVELTLQVCLLIPSVLLFFPYVGILPD